MKYDLLGAQKRNKANFRRTILFNVLISFRADHIFHNTSIGDGTSNDKFTSTVQYRAPALI